EAMRSRARPHSREQVYPRSRSPTDRIGVCRSARRLNMMRGHLESPRTLPHTRIVSQFIEQRPTLRLLARILRENGRAYLPRYMLAFLFMFVFAGTTALSAWMMKDVINKIFVDRDPAALAWIPGAILAIFTVKGLASYLQE